MAFKFIKEEKYKSRKYADIKLLSCKVIPRGVRLLTFAIVGKHKHSKLHCQQTLQLEKWTSTK